MERSLTITQNISQSAYKINYTYALKTVLMLALSPQGLKYTSY